VVQPSHSRVPSVTSLASPSTPSQSAPPAPNVPISNVPPRPDIAPGLTFSSLLRVPADIRIPDVRPARPKPAHAAAPPRPAQVTPPVPDARTTIPSTSVAPVLSPALSIASSDQAAAGPKSPRQKPSSWAELLKSPSPSNSPSVAPSPLISSTSNKPINVWSAVPTSPANRTAPLPAKEKGSRGLLESALVGIEDRFSAPFLHPRGLINKGNLCFENSVSERAIKGTRTGQERLIANGWLFRFCKCCYILRLFTTSWAFCNKKFPRIWEEELP
jgi:ubiquitin carboxyl-terminal hydrolase 10